MDWSSLKKHLPSRSQIRSLRAFKPLRRWIFDYDLWHLNKRSVSKGASIGVACAFVPLPGQMVIAAVLAVFFRGNLPLAVAGPWITNPLTLGPIFFFTYKVGTWILGADTTATEFDVPGNWWMEDIRQIFWPLLLGSFICGLVSALAAFATVRLVWRLNVVKRWEIRRRRRNRGVATPELS